MVAATPFPCKALTSSTLPLQVLNVRLYCIDDNCLSFTGQKNSRYHQGHGCKRTVDLCGGTRVYLRFEAVCKKSGVVHPSPYLNHLKLYQKIAKVLASYLRALFMFKITWSCGISKDSLSVTMGDQR